ncbi:hypothetical protein [Rhodohalobacter sp. SW132]|uniref:hypothetical protein n=1 Tax=Rhodohalobacter sp. SW132 TaxID=2293433 RepID=UPI001F47BF50|nr:hypothetical protein [Rhodohalobacter sp. SW132]
MVALGVFIPLFPLLVGAEFGLWPFGQGRHTNVSGAAPCSVVVGVINLVALNQLRVMSGQQARGSRLMRQVRGFIVGIPADRLVGQVFAKQRQTQLGPNAYGKKSSNWV